MSPHADAEAVDEASTPEAGEAYDAEAPRYDGSADAYRPADARPADAQTRPADTGVQDAEVAACESEPIPADAGTFHATLPTVTPRTGGDAGAACGAGEVTEFYDDCFGSGASAAACDVWASGGGGTLEQQTCATCIDGVTPGAGAYVTPLPGEPYEDFLNQVACVLATDPSPAGVACAQDLLDLELCSAASCASCTSDGVGGGTDPYGNTISSCETAAQGGACATYQSAVTADCADLDAGGAAAVCNPAAGATFETSFIAFAIVLCGGS